ncbi:hypothetical protein ThrDRAFT_04780 [Frankia casuarinae]|uniref:Signal transduction protein with Nacht domain n=1 Tax=Frankia casuarinae (strain DSM 45818 / CECT 9043 / HFP020203 / CcI3) TaxID=106370 RepID=Q2JGS9_FRACC|nr:NACHT domain-containing protein [Frankia casuarinae]ABD09513.1 putative signal transduction protein with Nacht domain [Frankia casuarinae]EYT89602.1 hypothetical protein ThrDRAFT_04780 [Frankia casuarinae]
MSGQGNEAGSLHRAGVAAWLVSHGINGNPIPLDDTANSGTIQSVDFETNDAIDDIHCKLTDGRTLLVQAKRACGDDRHLKDTVYQWARQRPEAGVIFGLAVAEPKGPVRHLRTALNRRRRSIPGNPSSGEKSALAALAKAFPVDISTSRREEILDSAYVLVVDAHEPGLPHFQAAASWLVAAGVPHERGAEAFEALRSRLQADAAKARGSDLDDWLEILAKAGYPLAEEYRGSRGQRRQFDLGVLARYCDRFQADRGMLSFALLADDLPPMKVEGLAKSFTVSWSSTFENRKYASEPLLDVARRWGRLVVTGLPGSGKSTAIRQLAAEWAATSDAPIPILVSLKVVAENPPEPASFTPAMLVDAALPKLGGDERRALHATLLAKIGDGDAALLLDGLDECGTATSTIADGITRLLEQLHPDTDVIVTARGSALPAASKTGLPTVELTEPQGLTSQLDNLIRHAAKIRANGQQEAEWAAARISWLESVRRADGHGGGPLLVRSNSLWQVPLLATMVTLLATLRPTEKIPTNRSLLFMAAVEESVTKWESRRAIQRVPWNVSDPRMLVDGFAVIAHELAHRSGRLSVEIARKSIRDRAVQYWGMSRGPAESASADIVRFWDEVIGAFPRNSDGMLLSRAQYLVDIGDAMWAAHVLEDEEERKAWVNRALEDPNRREAFILAVLYAPSILHSIETFHGSGNDRGRRALVWAADAIREGGRSLMNVVTPALMAALADAAGKGLALPDIGSNSAGQRSGRDPKEWEYVLRLAGLPVVPQLRKLRDDLLAGLRLNKEHRLVSQALTSLTDAVVDGHTEIPNSSLAALKEMLAVPAPRRVNRPPRRNSRGVMSFTLPERRRPIGYADVLKLAAEYAGSLDSSTRTAIYSEAREASVRDYFEIVAVLQAKGFSDPQPFFRVPELIRLTEEFPSHWAAVEWLFRPMENISEGTQLRRVQRWRPAEILEFTELIGLRASGLDDLRAGRNEATTTIESLVKCVCSSYRISESHIAAQAAYIASIASTGDQQIVRIILGIPPAREVRFVVPSTEFRLEGLESLLAGYASTCQILSLFNLCLSDSFGR